jgi:hypothetical protein
MVDHLDHLDHVDFGGSLQNKLEIVVCEVRA